MSQFRGRLSPRQVRILAFAWMGVVLLMGACIFLAILWALSNSEGSLTGGGQDEPTVVAQNADQPTPTFTLPPPPVDNGDAGADPAAVPTIPPKLDPSFGYGIQVRLEFIPEQTLDIVNQLGLTWIKQQIRWYFYEREPDVYEWALLDAYFAALEGRDTKVMLSILAAPPWAASVTSEGTESPPDDPAQYADFIGALIDRYPGQIHAIELWNEQNLVREWYTAGGLSAQGYVNLIAPAAAVIRAKDPNIIIISGALAPTGVNEPSIAQDDFSYLQAMVEAGMLNHVDCIGAHANGINLPPDLSYTDAAAQGPPAGTLFVGSYTNPHPSWSFYSTLNGYHDILVASGNSDVRLCVTEFGWASVEGMFGEPNEAFNFAYDNSLEDQAAYVTQAYSLMHDWGFVWLAFLFNLDFSPKGGGDPQDDSTLYSLMTGDGNPRPSFDAVRDMPKPP